MNKQLYRLDESGSVVTPMDSDFVVATLFVDPDSPADELRIRQGMDRKFVVRQIIKDLPEFAEKYNIRENIVYSLFNKPPRGYE